jgi:hypothetical protein
MTTDNIAITETGCYFDNHRGHYITPAVIEFAVEKGFMIGPFEQFAVDMYDSFNFDQKYPHESLQALADEARDWLNSGQDECDNCTRGFNPKDGEYWTHANDSSKLKRCKKCTGTGRGPRIDGQNFPPVIPDGFMWGWNDGDFGLYASVLFNIYDADSRKQLAESLDKTEAREYLKHKAFVTDAHIKRFLDQTSDDIALQIGGYTVEAIDPVW